jgi:hypothetical protein
MFQSSTIAYLAEAVRDAMKEPGHKAAAGVAASDDRRARDELQNDLDADELLSLVTDLNFTDPLEKTA